MCNVIVVVVRDLHARWETVGLRVVELRSGGGPSSRRTVEVGAVE